MAEPAVLHSWVAERPNAEVRSALERLRHGDDIVAIAVMPDVHLAGEVCVGVALATTSRILPAAVGSDIGCGMMAIAFEGAVAGAESGAEIERAVEAAPRILSALAAAVPVIRHPTRRRPTLPDDLAEQRLACDALERAKQRDATLELGSLGRGNHFVELQADEDGRLWAMIHSGSRGIGQHVRNWHESQATHDGAQLRGFAADSDAGRAYLADLDWALRYADENRRRILAEVTRILADLLDVHPLADTRVACRHNFVRCECHEGRNLWVHRKGAISAFDGEPGIIPGSMGSASYIVEGRGEPRSLCSSSHGAGRALPRGEAMRRISIKQLRRELRGVCFDERLVDRLRDEAPGAYKDIGAVMRAQRELTRIRRRLRPLVAFKGA
jgi:tRNA-splicing ligase RtcB